MDEHIPPAKALKLAMPMIDTVGEPFGGGGFKSVYSVQIEGRTEALKVISINTLPDGTNDERLSEAYRTEQIRRVEREVEALRKCKSPELVKLGAIGLTGFLDSEKEYLAYTEEIVEGSDLSEMLSSRDELPSLEELIELCRTLLVCIDELWSHGYIHRDIKPANIMKTGNINRPFVLLDLGIAYSVSEASITYRAADRLPLATYRYLAPEMLRPDFRDRIDYRADLYTTGLTVFEYASGIHPLARTGDDMISSISRALNQRPRQLEELRQDLPADFCRIINGLIKKKPLFRPANLNMILRRLEEFS